MIQSTLQSKNRLNQSLIGHVVGPFMIYVYFVLSLFYLLKNLPTSDSSHTLSLQRFSLSFEHCPLCNFRPLKAWKDSSSNDLFLTYVYGLPTDLYTCLRSLRTTMSRCQIAVLMHQSLTRLVRDPFFHQCDIKLYPIQMNLSRHLTCKYGVNTARWMVYRDYLNQLKDINRICISDADVVLQEDPFSTYFVVTPGHEIIYFLEEDINIDDSPANIDWCFAWFMPQLGDHPPSQYLHKRLHNSGSLFGTLGGLTFFATVMAARFLKTLAGDHICNAGDQGAYNNIIYSGILQKNNIEVRAFATMASPYSFLAEYAAEPYPNVTITGSHKYFYIHHLVTTNQQTTIRPICPKLGEDDVMKHEMGE